MVGRQSYHYVVITGCIAIYICVAYARSLVSQGVKFYTQEPEDSSAQAPPSVRLDKSNILLLGPTGSGRHGNLVV